MPHDNLHGHRGDSDVDRALDRLTAAMDGTFKRILAEIQDLKKHQPTGFATERTQTAMLNTLGAIAALSAENAQTLAQLKQQGTTIMSELTDLKASVAELKKDSARSLEALTKARTDLADISVKLDEALKSTHLNDEDRAAVDEIKTMVNEADAAIEEKVPEAAPAPEPPTP